MGALNSHRRRRRRIAFLISDNVAEARLIADRAARVGWRMIVCRSMAQARATLRSTPNVAASAVILDEERAEESTCKAIAELKASLPRAVVVLITANDSGQVPLFALRAGASDYLIKPIAPDRLLRALRTAVTRPHDQREDLEPFAEQLGAEADFGAMIGSDPSFRAALAQAAARARGHGHVLLEGESGVGKNMLARAIHAASPRGKASLRSVNVRGLSDAAIESLLFGYVSGAFVGAFTSKPGLLHSCEGGTLILEQVNRLSPAIQQRLAEALSTGRVRPLGANHSFSLGMRILALANRPLDELVARGAFSKDLRSALPASPIQLPPLRKRMTDLPLLAHHFLTSMRLSAALPEFALTDEAIALLGRFHWPGNIRQLQAVLCRAAAFANSPALTTEDFAHLRPVIRRTERASLEWFRPRSGVTLFDDCGHLRTLADIEADVIRLATGHYAGQMSEAARRLGIGRSTLYRRLIKLGVQVHQS